MDRPVELFRRSLRLSWAIIAAFSAFFSGLFVILVFSSRDGRNSESSILEATLFLSLPIAIVFPLLGLAWSLRVRRSGPFWLGMGAWAALLLFQFFAFREIVP